MEAQPGIALKHRPFFTDSVKWNDDGQVAFCVDSHVHILVYIVHKNNEFIYNTLQHLLDTDPYRHVLKKR